MSLHSLRDEFDRQLKSAEQELRKAMPAPNAISGLAGKLREHLARAMARAEAIAGDMEKSVSNLHARMDDADKMKREIDTAANEIHQVVGMDNGGPEIDHGR